MVSRGNFQQFAYNGHAHVSRASIQAIDLELPYIRNLNAIQFNLSTDCAGLQSNRGTELAR